MAYMLSKAVEVLEKSTNDAQQILERFLRQYLYGTDKNADIIIESSPQLNELLQLHILDQKAVTEYDLSLFSRNELNDLVAPYVSGMGYKNGRTLKIQNEWIKSNIPDVIPRIGIHTTTVTLNADYQKVKRKLYSYLLRKFETDSYFDGNTFKDIPHGSIDYLTITTDSMEISTEFPDDEITDLLNKYEANRNQR